MCYRRFLGLEVGLSFIPEALKKDFAGMDTQWALGKYGKYDMHYNMCIENLISH